ncbi:MAG: hypothetical protein WC044_02155 [Crocinitomicaceae bacterium]
MKIIITFIAIALLNTALFAQNDTLSTTPNASVEIFDVVGVYRSHVDARGITRNYTSELKGKILNHDQSTGLLTFQGRDGKMYSFTSTQYEYFKYDKEFTTKIKKQKVLNPRKDAGIGFHVGLSGGILNIPTGFQQDENYVGGTTGGGDLPVCIKIGANKYLNKNSSAGLTAEYSLMGSNYTYFNIGARFQYLYNPNKNSTFYFPAELKFSHYQADYYVYQYNDTTYTDNGKTWPTDFNAEVTLNAVELNMGQGVSFALKNKRSLSLEFMLLKQFILSQNLKIPVSVAPKTDFNLYGAKLSLFMNF